MTKIENGFSHLEALLVIVVVAVIGGIGFNVLHHSKKVNSVNAPTVVSTTTQPASSVGTIQGIENLTAQDASSESSIDSTHSTSDQTTSQDANSSASNIGGAYNESNI